MIAPDHSHDNVQISKKNLKTIGAIIGVLIILALFTFGVRAIKNKMASSGGNISANSVNQPNQSNGYSGEDTKESQDPENAILTDQDKQEIETLVRNYFELANRGFEQYKQDTEKARPDNQKELEVFNRYYGNIVPEAKGYFLPESIRYVETENKNLVDRLSYVAGFTIESVIITNVQEFLAGNQGIEMVMHDYIRPNRQFGFDALAIATLNGQQESAHVDPLTNKITGWTKDPYVEYVGAGKKNNRWYLLLKFRRTSIYDK